MKKSLGLLVVLSAIMIVGTAFSATTKTVAKALVVKGKVSAVDSAAATVTVAGKKGDVVFNTDANTVIKVGKETKTLADVKAGDTVRITYKVVDGKNLASEIVVSVPTTKK
ncbi:MAG: DUF5666 domain-containing protein [Brevinematia bacterium]